jgi:hypothetical protein
MLTYKNTSISNLRDDQRITRPRELASKMKCGYHYKAQNIESAKAYKKVEATEDVYSCADQGTEGKGEGKKMIREEQKAKNNKMMGHGQKRQEGEEN